VARFTEHKYREGWWFLTFALLGQSKCKDSKAEYKQIVDEFVEYLIDYLPTKKGGIKIDSYGKK
jgi:uncharacterized protein YaaR (DUF327 family)